MRVLSVAYPFALVGTGEGGGAETILGAIDAAIVSAGWDSLVLAPEGSRTSGRLIATPRPPRELSSQDRVRIERDCARVLADAVATCRPDVVHHHGIGFERIAPEPHRHEVVSLHLPIEWLSEAALARPRTIYVAVSRMQAHLALQRRLRVVRIDNGVSSLPELACRTRTGFVWIGRLCPEKAPHEAVAAAKAADAELVIAGPVFPFPDHISYVRETLLPMLDERRRWIGPVNAEQRAALLAGARAVLVTSRAPETSSLSAMEAAAAGAPVIAYPSGALADIVREGINGRLAEDTTGIARAMRTIGDIPSWRCRAQARARFSGERMARRHLALYRRLARQRADA